MVLPSNKLLNELLNTKVRVLKHIEDKDRKYRKEVFIICDDEGSYDLSPAEIIDICKEWIFSKDYHINTSEDKINNYIYLYKITKTSRGYEIDKTNGVQFDSKGYLTNLIEACEWILEQDKHLLEKEE